MEEAPENGKESSHSAHANGMNGYEYTSCLFFRTPSLLHRRATSKRTIQGEICELYTTYLCANEIGAFVVTDIYYSV
jgi:hypothetical protein